MLDGSSIMPSRHSIPQDLCSPCLNLTNYARTVFTPTMFSRRRTLAARLRGQVVRRPHRTHYLSLSLSLSLSLYIYIYIYATYYY